PGFSASSAHRAAIGARCSSRVSRTRPSSGDTTSTCWTTSSASRACSCCRKPGTIWSTNARHCVNSISSSSTGSWADSAVGTQAGPQGGQRGPIIALALGGLGKAGEALQLLVAQRAIDLRQPIQQARLHLLAKTGALAFQGALAGHAQG